METLTERVYECTLPVEAHMVCDLLARAGISARVDGEFLAGGGGELPLGNSIKVRVDPGQVVEARAVIAEWEREQPPQATAPPVRAPWRGGVTWFLIGLLAGGTVLFFALNTPVTVSGVDYDGDGVEDDKTHFAGIKPTRAESDRNLDGKVDARWLYDGHGLAEAYEGDDNFDGRFEWTGELVRGQISVSRLDADGDGRTDQTWHSRNGVLRTIEFHADGRVVKRDTFVDGLLSSAERDADGDGIFERRVQYDRFAEPQ